jgi:hypothetical protein
VSVINDASMPFVEEEGVEEGRVEEGGLEEGEVEEGGGWGKGNEGRNGLQMRCRRGGAPFVATTS